MMHVRNSGNSWGDDVGFQFILKLTESQKSDMLTKL